MSRVCRPAVVALMIGALFASAAPVSAARPGTFNFDACWNGTSVEASLSWSGVRVSQYSFGMGQDDGFGFGYFEPVEPAATSGNASGDPDFFANVDDTVDLVGGGVYGHSQRRAIKSDQVHRPVGGWATLDPC